MSGIGMEGVANAADQPGILPGPGGVADDLPVAGVDEQADVVPRGPDAHVGQVAAYMGARRPTAEAARDDVRHVGLVDRPGVHLEPLPAACANRAVPHDVEGPATADGGGWRRRQPIERRVHLARAVPALAGAVEGRAPRRVGQEAPHEAGLEAPVGSSHTRRTASWTSDQSSSGQPFDAQLQSPRPSHPQHPGHHGQRELPFSGNTSPHLSRVLLLAKKAAAFLGTHSPS